jgi:hypothetical protein
MIVQQFGDSLLADASHGMMERIPFPSTVISRCVLLYVLKRFIMEVIMMTPEPDGLWKSTLGTSWSYIGRLIFAS